MHDGLYMIPISNKCSLSMIEFQYQATSLHRVDYHCYHGYNVPSDMNDGTTLQASCLNAYI